MSPAEEGKGMITKFRGEIREVVERAVEPLQLSDELDKDLRRSLEQGSEGGAIAMLLALCLELEYLELTTVYDIDKTLISAMIDESCDQHSRAAQLTAVVCGRDGSRPRPLTKLREVAVRSPCAPEILLGLFIQDVAPLLRTPALEIFRGHGMECVGSAADPPKPRSSLIRHMHIDEGVLEGEGIKFLLETCPHLIDLQYSVSRTMNYVEPLEFLDIGEQLRSCGSALQTLVLNTGEGHGNAPLGDLRLCPITTLTATRMALLGSQGERKQWWINTSNLADELPRSLETLEILECATQCAAYDASDVERKGNFEHLNDHVARLVTNPEFKSLSLGSSWYLLRYWRRFLG